VQLTTAPPCRGCLFYIGVDGLLRLSRVLSMEGALCCTTLEKIRLLGRFSFKSVTSITETAGLWA
jgi:hypothetical protein